MADKIGRDTVTKALRRYARAAQFVPRLTDATAIDYKLVALIQAAVAEDWVSSLFLILVNRSRGRLTFDEVMKAMNKVAVLTRVPL